MWNARAIFSKAEESLVLESYLPKRPSFYVEVGANHPVKFSQTYALEMAGWEGALIEPLEENCDLLRQQRRAAVFQCACGPLNRHNTTANIHVAGDHGALSSITPDRLRAPSASSRRVSVVTLDSIIESLGRSKIDFVSIDVEGAEPEVVDGFTPQRWDVDLVLVEDHGLGEATHRAMTSKGYKRVRRTGDNSWYVPLSTSFPISVFGRCQLLRKYYLSRPVRKAKGLIKATAALFGNGRFAPRSAPLDSPPRSR